MFKGKISLQVMTITCHLHYSLLNSEKLFSTQIEKKHVFFLLICFRLDLIFIKEPAILNFFLMQVAEITYFLLIQCCKLMLLALVEKYIKKFIYTIGL